MSHKQHILQLLASTPGLRTVQLADKIDLGIDQTLALLKEMEAVDGTVTSHEVEAPSGGGRKATAWECTERGKSLAAPSSVAAAAGSGLTNVERAVAFIAAREDKTATSAELHSLLDLKPTEYASSYLNGGIRDGRLLKDGKNWTLGPKALAPDASTPSATVAPTPATSTPMADIVSAISNSQEARSTTAPVLSINLIEEPTFTAQVGDTKIPGLRVASEWHGMQELRDPQGRMLIVDRGADSLFGKLFDDLFGLGSKTHPATIVKGHPDLVHALLPAVVRDRLDGAGPGRAAGPALTPPRA